MTQTKNVFRFRINLWMFKEELRVLLRLTGFDQTFFMYLLWFTSARPIL